MIRCVEKRRQVSRGSGAPPVFRCREAVDETITAGEKELLKKKRSVEYLLLNV